MNQNDSPVMHAHPPPFRHAKRRKRLNTVVLTVLAAALLALPPVRAADFNVFGGYSENGGDVTGNTVTMSGGELVKPGDASNPRHGLSGDLYGGYADKGSAARNTANVSGETVSGTCTAATPQARPRRAIP